MHNFDLGITAEILRMIEEYFSVLFDARTATKVVDCSNSNQARLTRRPQTGFFRLPRIGTMIAPSHANVTGYEFFASICVVPFMVFGAVESCTGLSEDMFHLLACIFSYLELHHFTRRVNTTPYHVYANVQQELLHLNGEFARTYRLSFGKTRGKKPGSSANELPEDLCTLKSHQLFAHLGFDILGGGLVSNFDAEAGESHHVSTRAHFAHSGKRADADQKIAIRSTVREIGVLSVMYPLKEAGSGPAPTPPSTTSSRGSRRNHVQPRRNLVTLTSSMLDGLELPQFQQLLVTSCQDGDIYIHREPVFRVKLLQTLSIECQFPWMKEQAVESSIESSTCFGDSRSRLKGTKQLIRASPSFYNKEPMYDFVELRKEPNQLLKIAQLRLLFGNHI